MAAELDQTDLLVRLAAGRDAGITVLTPNRRLAQSLAAEFGRRQVARGLASWEAPDILPWPAFVERLYEDARDGDEARDLPLLLGVEEEHTLWEEVLRKSQAGNALLAVPETAALAREAWQLAHAWRLWRPLAHAGLGEDARTDINEDARADINEDARADLNEDARVFIDWAERYRRATARIGRTDAARLPELLARRLGDAALRKPRLLVRYAFEQATPQQDAFLAALAAQGSEIAVCAPARGEARATRLACLDARDEMRRAALWARARLEAAPPGGGARIGVVLPDLAQQRDALRRVFAQILAPAADDPRAAGARLPFNVSLGEPLAACPLVAHALLVLELCGREIEFERASRLLRSPFIAQGEAEMPERARLDAALRRRAEPLLTLDRLALLAARDDLPRCPALARRLAALAAFRKERLFGARSARAWGEAFGEALALAGFPGERELDSTEYQTLKKWHATLAQFALLERVAPRMGFGDALARLRRIAAATLFQPETPELPIQLLGVLEAAGMRFEHLWVMGLSDEAWPMRAQANPLIPIRLQRAAGVPNASPAAGLEFARRLTAGWFGAAGELVLSHPQREGDRALAPSPLIAQIAEAALDLPDHAGWRAAIHGARRIERIAEARAPARAGAAARGGAALVKDQAACAFRALAIHRLGAEGVGAPHSGLDALERGTLVHRVLASAWRELKTKWTLDDTPALALDALLARAAKEAIDWQRRDRPGTLAGRFAQIEQQRLVRLARGWLDHERARADFTVIATEEQRELALGPLALNLRLDRVDETAAGERIVIDYKTGRPALASVLGERPDEPQLPLYLVAGETGAAALAFAQVSAGAMKFVGLAREDGLLEGAKSIAQALRLGAAPSWDEQLAFWRAELERLAARFAAGHAEVDPKRGLHTCRGCDLQPFCRIHERIGPLPEEEDA
ncbi:MAG: PD-(D/E)XK nuclease family protein [Betaproteobacteria bacterium]|nr:PD-(D/E)XK nuclease family protein [Betaproteobacteria bacterium]